MSIDEQPKYGHYFKDVSHLNKVDVYRVIDLWQITDPALQHALKKVLAAGKRGAKNQAQDVDEAIDSLVRWKEMQAENELAVDTVGSESPLTSHQSVLTLTRKSHTGVLRGTKTNTVQPVKKVTRRKTTTR